ncbi:MAG: DUF502 domain-containing protein [Bdellovibrionota bacterium]
MTRKPLAHSLRDNIITGALVLTPIGAVLWIVVWLWGFLMNLSGLLPQALHPKEFLDVYDPLVVKMIDVLVTLVSSIAILGFVWFIGLISRNYIGQHLISIISGFFSKVPVLSTVYSTLEQLLKTFGSGQSKNFRRVVQIEYPRKGLYTLAFVTGERDEHPITGKEGKYLTIYVPTTPNPTSGFYLSVSSEEVHDVGLSVEQALKEIISMGIVRKDD